MRSSGQEDEAVVKQGSSGEEEPVLMQIYRDPDEAIVMQRCGDEATECLGLDHPGQNKKERPKQNNSNNRCAEN